MMNYRVVLYIIHFALFACTSKMQVTNKADYAAFLRPEFIRNEMQQTEKEIKFWENRVQKDTGNFVFMMELAKYQFQRYRLTGNIGALLLGDSLLKKSSSRLKDSDPDILFALTQNSILQHQFIQASMYNEAALKNRPDQYTLKLLQFDVWMELGKYGDAYKSLQALQDKSAFDYLIRKAKWEDHKGNLHKAIELMEVALGKVKLKNKTLYHWTLTNLADMYGHAGRINEAYRHYLAALKSDPADLYCLKGIAWIAYAYDNNPEEAKNILEFIITQRMMPEALLLLSEIADSQKQDQEKLNWLSRFLDEVSKPGYGAMYNKYLIDIWAEDPMKQQNAVDLATSELTNRFTPETCDWMAWALYKSGKNKEAFRWASSYVVGQTSEPDAIMHSAFIYAANGMEKEAKKMFKECLESSFELGPVATSRILEALYTKQ